MAHVRMSSLLLLVLYGMLGLVSAPALAQQVYRCPGPGGQTAFQQVPCAGGSVVNVAPGNVVEADRGAIAQARTSHLIATGRVGEGMTASQVQSAWGNPRTVNRTITGGVVTEQWVYRHGGETTRYVYLRDGVVDGLQEHQHERVYQPRAERCPDELAIRNALVSARALDITSPERARRMAAVEAMRRCR